MASLLSVSQKCQYALRALFELSARFETGKITTVADIASSQNIPIRFLEQILNKIRTGGFIDSRRGKQGGYIMALAPSAISVGEIIRFIEGPEDSIECIKNNRSSQCRFDMGCAFKDLWTRAKDSMTDIFDGTTFQDLVDKQKKSSKVVDYSI